LRSVLVADDHPIVRNGIAREITETEGLTLAATASDGPEALALVRRYEPDVALLDLDMPGLNGLDVLKPIKEEDIPTKVVILTGSAEEEWVFAALTAGASGYLLKSAPWEEIAQAVKTVSPDKPCVDPGMLAKFVGRVSRKSDLTEEEIETLKVYRTMTAKDAGYALCVTEAAIRKRLKSVYAKLGVSGKYEALNEATARGIL